MKLSPIMIQLLLSSLFLLGPSPNVSGQWAQTVFVDLQAEHSVLAKEKGLNDGEHQAFIKLIEEIAPQSASNKVLIRETAGKCSGGYEVQEEKFSGTRYRAKVIYHFHDRCVLAELKNLGISVQPLNPLPSDKAPHADAPLLLVVEHTRGQQQMASPWQESATFPLEIYNHFAAREARVIFPLHDLTDQTLLPHISLDKITFKPFQAIAQHYQTDTIHLLVLTKHSGGITLTPHRMTPFQAIQFASTEIPSLLGETEESKTQRVAELALTTFASPALANTLPPNLGESALQTPPPEPMATAPGGEAPEEQADLAPPLSTGSPYAVQVHFDSLQTWLHLKKLLTRHPNVQQIDLRELTHQTALFSVQLKTSLKTWQDQLNELGLKTTQISEQSIAVRAVTTLE